MSPARTFLLGCLAVLFVTPATSLAQQVPDNPRALGMGGAVRGDPLGTSAVLYNPAGMSRAYLYSMEGQYFRGAPGELNSMSLAVVDAKTQPELAVGVAYAYTFSDGDAEVEVDGHDARLAFARAVVPNRMHLGVGLHYINRDVGEEGLEAFTLDAGLFASITGAFHVGVVGENLIAVDDPAHPRRLGGGLSYTGEFVTLTGDVVFDFDGHEDGAKPLYKAGLEILAAETVPIRAGFSRSEVTEHSWLSGGIGFVGDGATSNGSQISVSYTQNLDVPEQFVLGVGLSFFL